MLYLIICILMIWAMLKLTFFGIRCAWGIFKIIFSIFLIPIVVIGLLLMGMIYLAIPILAIIGLVSLFGSKSVA